MGRKNHSPHAGNTLHKNVGLISFSLVLFISGCMHFSSDDANALKDKSKKENSGRHSLAKFTLPHPPKPVILPNEPERLSRYGNHSPYTVLGETYQVESAENYKEEGLASWYGKQFQGKPTSNFEPFDMYEISAAHKTLPLPTYVKVTNLDNNQSLILRVNDRGPFHEGRIIDLSYAAAVKLGFAEKGTTRARVETVLPPEIPKEHKLFASLNRPHKSKPIFLQPIAAQKTTEKLISKQQISKQTMLEPAKTIAEKSINTAITAKTETAKTDDKPYLQMGAFSVLSSAQKMVSKLNQLVSVPLEIKSETQKKGEIHKVQIGPLDDKGEIELVKNTIKRANFPDPLLVWR